MKLLIRWFLSAATLMGIAYYVPGFHVGSFGTALIAAIVIGLVNATLGAIIKFVTFPLTIITLGLFLILINAAMLKVAAVFVSGFHVDTWLAAIIGAVLMSLSSSLVHWLLRDDRERR